MRDIDSNESIERKLVRRHLPVAGDDKLRSEVPVSRSYVPAVKRALGI